MPPIEICSECHFTPLREHPEDKFKDLGYVKCPLCGFTKHNKIEIKELHKIINGNPGKQNKPGAS